MSRSPLTLRSTLLALPLLGLAQSALALVTVGPDASCDFHKVQDAIDHVIEKERNHPDDVDPYIGLAGSNAAGDRKIYNERLVIDGNQVSNYTDPSGYHGAFVQIYGDLDHTCSVENGSAAYINSAGSQAGNSVIEIIGASHVILNHMTLAEASGVNRGGGINVHGTGYLDVSNTVIESNHAVLGGGIAADGAVPGLSVTLHGGVIIQNNTVSGSGGGIFASGEVFLSTVGGNTNTIAGNTANDRGGGVDFEGRGSLHFDNIQIAGNSANDGGGMNLRPSEATQFNLHEGVFIAANTATGDGGGVYLGDRANLVADASVTPTQIFSNKVLSVDKSGGGVFLLGPANMTFTGSIFSNSAGKGGGIAALSGQSDGDDVGVRLKAANANSPVSVSGNSALQEGGGIYARAFGTALLVRVGANLDVSDFLINGNSAPEGSAYFGTAQSGVVGSDRGPFLNLFSRGVCNHGIACNEVSGNFQDGGNAAEGTVLRQPTNSIFTAYSVKFQSNQGGHLLRTDGSDFDSSFRNVLISDNNTAGELMYMSDHLSVIDSTIAHNTIGASHVLRAPKVELTNTIIAEDVTATMDFAGNNGTDGKHVNYVLTNPQDSTLQNLGPVIYGDPEFVDVAAGDYHLSVVSPAIDQAPVPDPPIDNDVDLDGAPRNQDFPFSPGHVGPRDLGAYEFGLNSDILFFDSFE